MAIQAHGISNRSDDEQDGIHLLWMPPNKAGYSLDGFDVWRRAHRRDEKLSCYTLDQDDFSVLNSQLRVNTPMARIGMRLAPCPTPPGDLPDEPSSKAEDDDEVNPRERLRSLIDDENVLGVNELRTVGNEAAATVLDRRLSELTVARSTIHQPKPTRCILYEFRLNTPCHYVRLRFRPIGGIALAFREDKVVAAEVFVFSQDHWQVELAREGIDRVMVWVARSATGIQVCCRNRLDLKPGEGWQDARLIAKNLQLPFRRVNPAVNTLAQEEGLAASRLLGSEQLGVGRFEDLSETMNGSVASHVSPVHLSTVVRDSEQQEFIEVSPWPLGLALSIEARWRRALGLAFLDKGGDLTEGDVYDYRIVGRFRRRDIEETLLGFHSVPLGTPLPRTVYLDQVRFDFSDEREVIAHPKIPPNALVHVFRKGVEIRGRATLTFPEPITRIVLELEPDSVSMNYRALNDGQMFIGLNQEVEGGALPAQRRVELDFDDPVVRLELNGRGLLYGVRLRTVAAGVDADDVIERDAYVTAVRYEETPSPSAPPVLGTTNLQAPLPVGDPQITAQTPPNLMGFKLWWLPPSSGNNWPEGWWPEDVPAAPPVEVVGFDIERRRVDTNGDWKPFDVDPENGMTALVGSARGSSGSPSQLRPGDDLLEHFPEVGLPVSPVPTLSSLEDVLISLSDNDGPPPGSLHQYRIRSVDAIGRRSDSATNGSIVQLRKRRPPPRPPGLQVDATQMTPRGVQARLLQASDPTLSQEEAALLDNRPNAVLLKWGWTAEERRADPWAKEFRLYWIDQPPDLIHGEFVGSASLSGGTYQLAAQLTADVANDEFAGQFVKAGRHPFRIVSHAGGVAGNPIVFSLAPSALAINPAPTPSAGRFTLRPELDGGELQPENWDERSHVVPITAETEYQWVFPQTLTLDADHPRARVWVGVSASDDQDYVADVIASTETNGGRPGNESSIVVAPVEGRWRGRPTLSVPPPLPNVPETVLPEVPGDHVLHAIDLPGLLASVSLPANLRWRLERLSVADLVSKVTARADDTIQIELPRGATTPYTLANPGDRSSFLAQIRTGEAARIENRFILDIAIKTNDNGFTEYWQRALPEAVELEEVAATVSNKAERYLYRVRAVDAANHVSAGAAYLPQVFRVPSQRMPRVPDLLRIRPAADHVIVNLRSAEQFDLQGVLLFSYATDDSSNADPGKPDLLRTPNRRDLYPSDGIRLRLPDGQLLEPSFHATSAAIQAGSVLTWELSSAIGFRKKVYVWAVTVTRDGVCSPIAGPLASSTGSPPPAVPTLSVSRANSNDESSWTTPTTTTLVRLERLLAGEWAPVTLWLTDEQTTYTVRHEAGVRYRLVAREGRLRTVGFEVTPT